MRWKLLLAGVLLFPVAASAQAPCTTDARQVVNAAYLQVLERPANRTVVDPLVAQLMRGETSMRQIIRELALSFDHRQRFLAVNTPAARETAVTALYRHLLARTPDEGGLRSHADALASSGDPATVINSMIDSSEYLQAWGEDTVPGGRARFCGAAGNSTAANTAVGPSRFGSMDRNANGVIERTEWNGSRGSFNVHDWNNDGVLSGDEVRQGARRTTPSWGEQVDFQPSMTATWTDDAFRQIDRNDDSRITSNQWFYASEYFWRADCNRDGSLTLAEFSGTSTPAATGAAPAWDDDRDDQFENLDFNNNGRIERGEWHGSLDAFQWLDRNRDNMLSRAEVVGEGTGQFNSFTSLDANGNGSLSIAEWRWSRVSFNRYDTNQDGILSRQEFAAGGGSPAAVGR